MSESSFSGPSPDVVDPYSRNLGRGKACNACRRRKLRCDGAKPSCNRCTEARQRKLDVMRRKGKSEADIQAIRFPACYDEGGDQQADATAAAAVAAVTASGRQMDATHSSGADNDRNNIFAVLGGSSSSGTLTDPSPSSSTPNSGQRPAKVRRTAGPGEPSVAAGFSSVSGDTPTTQNDLFFAEILSSHLPIDASTRTTSNDPFPVESSSNEVTNNAFNGNSHASLTGGNITSAYWQADTDIGVPPEPLLSRLVDIFFEEHSMAYIFHPGRLRERLSFDVRDPRYPHPSVLHIIAALAFAARPDLDEELSGGVKPSVRTGSHYRHFLAAQHSVSHTIHSDVDCNTFDIARACLLFTIKAYGQGDQLESYLHSAQAARLCVSLNLNRDVPSRAEQQMQQLQFLLMQPRITDASIIRPEPSDEIEAEELRRSMVFMFAIDRTTIVATLWPGALIEDDYTAELPRAKLDEFLQTTTHDVSSQTWTQRRSGLTLQSHDFFSRRAIDAEQFFLKAIILLGRCALYVSRLPRTASREQIVSATRFQQLESWIASLHLESYEIANMAAKSPAGHSASHSAGSPTGGMWAPRKSEGSLASYLMASGRSDMIRKGYIITSSIIPYACTLTLHEPLAGLSSESETRCQAATRGAINILRLCAVHAEEEMQRLDVVMTIMVMLVGRSLIRQLESLYSTFIAQEMAQQQQKSGVAGNGSVTGTGGAAASPDNVKQSPSASASAAVGVADDDSVWKSDEFTESVSLLQADLEVVLLTLKRFGQKWLIALKMHDSLLKLLQFNPEHRLRGLFCLE